MFSPEHDHIANEIHIAAENGNIAELVDIEHELHYGYAWLTDEERSHLISLVRRYL